MNRHPSIPPPGPHPSCRHCGRAVDPLEVAHPGCVRLFLARARAVDEHPAAQCPELVGDIIRRMVGGELATAPEVVVRLVPPARSHPESWLAIVPRCPYCSTRHTHGAGKDGTTLGHRTAHCADFTGPGRELGYVLVRGAR